MNPTKKRTACIYTALNRQNPVKFVTEKKGKRPFFAFICCFGVNITLCVRLWLAPFSGFFKFNAIVKMSEPQFNDHKTLTAHKTSLRTL